MKFYFYPSIERYNKSDAFNRHYDDLSKWEDIISLLGPICQRITKYLIMIYDNNPLHGPRFIIFTAPDATRLERIKPFLERDESALYGFLTDDIYIVSLLNYPNVSAQINTYINRYLFTYSNIIFTHNRKRELYKVLLSLVTVAASAFTYKPKRFYDRQVILDFNTESLLAKHLKSAWQFKHPQTERASCHLIRFNIENHKVVALSAGPNPFSPLQQLTHNSRLYINAHGWPTSKTIWSEMVNGIRNRISYRDLAKFLADNLNPALKLPSSSNRKLRISLTSCSSGDEKKGQDSFAAGLERKLYQYGFEVYVIARVALVIDEGIIDPQNSQIYHKLTIQYGREQAKSFQVQHQPDSKRTYYRRQGRQVNLDSYIHDWIEEIFDTLSDGIAKTSNEVEQANLKAILENLNAGASIAFEVVDSYIDFVLNVFETAMNQPEIYSATIRDQLKKLYEEGQSLKLNKPRVINPLNRVKPP